MTNDLKNNINIEDENNNKNNSEVNSENNFEFPWILINSYFKNFHLKQLVRHQLESYNYFVSTQIENTIEMLIHYEFVQKMTT